MERRDLELACERAQLDVAGLCVEAAQRLVQHDQLYAGDVAAAAAALPPDEPDVLMLAAASEGAHDALISRALAAAPEQISPELAIYGHALAQRAGRDPKPYLARFATLARAQAARIEAFFVALDRDPAAAEKELAGLPFELRAFALAAGTVTLGVNTPAHWREIAKLRLFPTERPFFR